MINYWFVSRPKRKLNSVPDVLSTLAELSLDEEWQGELSTQLSFEKKLEEAGLKRIGERRDGRAGGARTYRAWIASLGLIFNQESTKKEKLTLAGEALINGANPTDIISNQVFKFQYPSPYSLSRGVEISSRFKIRPFVFLLRLLLDSRINYLTNDELAKIVITEAENETDRCYEYIVNRILEYRDIGDSCLANDFFEKYGPSKGTINIQKPFGYLQDIANTIFNWLEYTQLIERCVDSSIKLFEDKQLKAKEIISAVGPFIDRPSSQEYFQRKFGLDPSHTKDTRNLTATHNISAAMIAKSKIQFAFIKESLKRPITTITADIIEIISNNTGYNKRLVEDTLLNLYPRGAIGSFLPEYFDMAFNGVDEATEFEKATVAIFRDIFHFNAKHVGPIGKTPDVLLLSDSDNYQAIIDNKAYSRYTISNDHHNRMVVNYIRDLSKYSDDTRPLSFFTYIAGGFGSAFDSQVNAIVAETGVSGSGINVSNMIELIMRQQTNEYSHDRIRKLFSVNRQVQMCDL